MALVKGTNAGFVTVAPTDDPLGSSTYYYNTALASMDVAPAGATKVTEIGWWCDDASREANFEVGLYSHNSEDYEPEARLYRDPTNAKGTTAGWKRVTGLNIPITAGISYWIAVQLDDTSYINFKSYGELGFAHLKPSSSLPSPWGTSTYVDTDGIYAIYAVYEAEQGFLDITGITAPESAHEGDTVNFTVHTQNTEFSDDFKVELSGDVIGSQEFFLDAGLTKDVPFSFIMPSSDVSITINTYHWELF